MKIKTRQTYLNKIMTAITFAEAGEYETARGILGQSNKKEKRPETRIEQRPAMEF